MARKLIVAPPPVIDGPACGLFDGCVAPARKWYVDLWARLFGSRKPCASCAARLVSMAKALQGGSSVCPASCKLDDGLRCPNGKWKKDGPWSVRVPGECKAVSRTMIALLEHGECHMVRGVEMRLERERVT